MIRPMVTPMITPMIKSMIRSFFSPADLFKNGEQGAWYDPSDISTLFQDAACTIPVTGDGDPVGCMLDKSPNGHDATQTVAVRRPIYRTSGGLSWLEFDGVDDWLHNLSLPASIDPTAAIGRRVEPSSSNSSVFSFVTTDINASLGLFNWGLDDLYGFNTWAADCFGISPGVSNVTGVDIAYFKSGIPSTSGVELYIDNIKQPLSQLKGIGTTRTIDVGLYIGRAGSETSETLGGNIYGVVVTDYVIGDADRASLNSWMAIRSGI